MFCKRTKLKYFYKIFFLILLHSVILNAQDEGDEDLPKLIEKADYYYVNKDYNKALKLYKNHLEDVPRDEYALLQVARCDVALKRYIEAKADYELYFKVCKYPEANAHIEFVKVLLQLNDYLRARDEFDVYKNLIESNDTLAHRYIHTLNYYEDYYSDTTWYEIERLPISSRKPEIGAIQFGDELYYILSRNEEDRVLVEHYSDIYVSDITNSNDKGFKLNSYINTKAGEIAVSVVENTNEAYITRFEEDETVEDKLVYSVYKAQIRQKQRDFLNLTELVIKDFEYNIAFPTFSWNGDIMIFASDAPGGFGGWDLYQASKGTDGYENPVNLGFRINTDKDELYPFLFKDNILYFSSDGHGGMGGLDIYFVDLYNSEQKSINMGVPINSKSNDYSISYNSNSSGLFISDREGGLGSDDIYKFKIKAFCLEGEVRDKNSQENIKNVDLLLIYDSGELDTFKLADNGRFRISVNPEESFSMSIMKEGYETTHTAVDYIERDYNGRHFYDIGYFEVEKEDEKSDTESDNNNQSMAMMTLMAIDSKINSLSKTQNKKSEVNKDITPDKKQDEEAVKSSGITGTSNKRTIGLIPSTRNKIQNDSLIRISDELVSLSTTLMEMDKRVDSIAKTKEMEKRIVSSENPPFKTENSKPKEKLFWVQIAASRMKISKRELKWIYKGDEEVYMFDTGRWYKYAIGGYRSFSKAKKLRDICGVKKAFVNTYDVKAEPTF